jgi:FHS family L-fucose permease-like MFS transporter
MPSSTQAPWFSDYDLYLLGEGTHDHAYEKMGAHLAEVDGQRAGYVSFHWGGAMIGRFVGSALARRMNPRRLLTLCAIVAPALVSASMLLGGHTAMWTILCVGFFNSIMFPTIFTLGEAELGVLTGSGSGILNMAIVGGAILPLI